MPDRTVWSRLYRSADGELVVKQNLDSHVLLVSAAGNTAEFKVKGNKVIFDRSVETEEP